MLIYTDIEQKWLNNNSTLKVAGAVHESSGHLNLLPMTFIQTNVFYLKKVGLFLIHLLPHTPQSTEVPYLDHGEAENEPIEKVYVTTLVTPMGLFNYVDGINSKITPKN